MIALIQTVLFVMQVVLNVLGRVVYVQPVTLTISESWILFYTNVLAKIPITTIRMKNYAEVYSL
jgi:hypothetical protein